MSAGNEWPQDPNMGATPPRQGMSGGMKFLVTILIVGGVCGVLCCGVGGYFAYKLKQGFQFTQNPDEVKEKSAAIAKMTIPDQFHPTLAMKLDLAGFKMAIAGYETTGKTGGLMLMEVPGTLEQAEAGLSQQMDQVRAQQRQQGGNNAVRELKVTEQHEEKVTIRGREVTARFAKGTAEGSETVYQQLTVAFPGKTAGASDVLIVQLPEDDWDEDEIETMLKSIE